MILRTVKDLVTLLQAARDALSQEIPREDLAEIRAGLDEAVAVIARYAVYRSEGE